MKTYILVVAGQLVSKLGSMLTEFGLDVWILQETDSPTMFSISVLLSALPRVILAPLAGALVDRWDRRRIMLVSDTVLAGKTLAVVLLLYFGEMGVWKIWVLNAVGSVFAGLHGLAWSASTTLLVPKKHLARVNGLSSAAGSGTAMVAPALAGVLYVLVGMPGIAAIDLASWAFAVVPLLFVRIPSPARTEQPAQRPRLLGDIARGWTVLRSMKGLLHLLLAYSAIGFFGVTTEVLRKPYVMTFAGPEGMGLVESVASLGFLAGALILGAVGNPRNAIRVILASELVVSLLSMVQGAFPTLGVLVPAVFVFSLAVAYCDGSIQALWQRKVPPEYQGRVFALKDTLNTALMPVGVMVFGALAEFWMQPRLEPGGAWANGVGRLIGTGPGRGMGLWFLLSGVVCVLVLVLAAVDRRVTRAELEMPDHGN